MLQHYHNLEPRALNGRTVFTKPGVRAYPELHPAAELFVKAEVSGGALLDASGSAGAAALAVLDVLDKAGLDKVGAVTVLEPSRAALRCAQKTFSAPNVVMAAGAVWDAPAAKADTVLLVPATDRGNMRVAAELAGAHAALRDGGAVYAAMHKDQGAKRYEQLLAARFGNAEILAKKRRLAAGSSPQKRRRSASLEPGKVRGRGTESGRGTGRVRGGQARPRHGPVARGPTTSSTRPANASSTSAAVTACWRSRPRSPGPKSPRSTTTSRRCAAPTGTPKPTASTCVCSTRT